jgi:hypothetical protein
LYELFTSGEDKGIEGRFIRGRKFQRKELGLKA